MASAQLPHYAALANFSIFVSTYSMRYFNLMDEHSVGIGCDFLRIGLLLLCVLSCGMVRNSLLY